MKILVCSPNLVGFLSAVYAIYKTHTDCGDIVSSADRNFLDTYVIIDEDVSHANSVKKGIIAKGGYLAYSEIADAYLSCNPHKEHILLEFLRLFFKHGKDALGMYHRTEVKEFNDMLNKVRHEAHRVSAFVRLMEMSNGAFYGYFSADNDILEKIAANLIPRLNTQTMVLHDYKRGKMCVYDGKKCEYLLVNQPVTIELSNQEQLFQHLWKQYHKNVSISSRENLKQQRAFLPKKYRHFMHEF